MIVVRSLKCDELFPGVFHLLPPQDPASLSEAFWLKEGYVPFVWKNGAAKIRLTKGLQLLFVC